MSLIPLIIAIAAHANEPSVFSRFEALANQSAEQAKACDAFQAAGERLGLKDGPHGMEHATREDAMKVLDWLDTRPSLSASSIDAHEYYRKNHEKIRAEEGVEKISDTVVKITHDCDPIGVRSQTVKLLGDLKKFPFSPGERKRVFAALAKPLRNNLPFVSLINALVAGADLEDLLRAKLPPSDFAKVEDDLEEYHWDGEGYAALVQQKHKALKGREDYLAAHDFEMQKVDLLTVKYRRLFKRVEAFLK